MKKNSNERNKFLSNYALKIALIMKLSLFLIFISVFQSFAVDLLSQKVTLKLSDDQIPILQVLDEIELQTDVRFLYRNETIENKSVRLDTNNKTWFEILEQIKLATNVDYRILEDNLVVLTPMSAKQPGKSISGTVTDQNGDPLIGVTVMIKGTSQGTITDAMGSYSISNVPEDGVLVFSYIGMATKEVAVGTQTIINVTLEEEAIGLDELVVVGYGRMKKSDLTGAVTRADVETFSDQPNVSLMQKLQGSVAGLNVSQVQKAGESPAFTIRGRTSLSGEQTPLIILDEVIFRGSLIDINPADIQSIDVLKDNSAAAVYGSQAANGVIIITTKTGEELRSDIRKIALDIKGKVEERAGKVKDISRDRYSEIVDNVIESYNKVKDFTEKEIELIRKIITEKKESASK